jgi:hypothetical protein
MEELYKETLKYRQEQDVTADPRKISEAIRVATGAQFRKIQSTIRVLMVSKDYQAEYYLHRNSIKSSSIFTEVNIPSYTQIQASALLVNAILISYNDTDSNIIENSAIHRLLTGITQIGNDSTYGYAMRAGIDDTERAFVLKILHPDEDQGHIYHEIYIGLCVANKFRRDGRPNYVACYGYFLCTPPITKLDIGEVLETCPPDDGEQRVPYCVYEYVPGENLTTYCMHANRNGILGAYLQILLALCDSKFTHYDLHTGNIILRPVERLQIHYWCTKDYYIQTSFIATMIDYGTCVYHGDPKTPGGTFDPWAWNSRMNRDLIFPIYDAYTLLMTMSATISDSNPTLLPVCQTIFQFFFADEDIQAAIQREDRVRGKKEETYFRLPAYPRYTGLSLHALVEYILSHLDCTEICSLTAVPNIPILNPNNSLTLAKISNQAGVTNQLRAPETIFEFYDIYNYIMKCQPELLQKLLRLFVYRIAATQHLDEVEKIIVKLEAIPWLTKPTSDFDDPSNDDWIVRNFDSTIRYRCLLDNVLNYVRIGQHVDILLQEFRITAWFAKKKDYFAACRTKICNHVSECVAWLQHLQVEYGVDYEHQLRTLEYIREYGCEQDILFAV